MSRVHVYTDGSCNQTTKQGGWGAVLIAGQHQKNLSGKVSNTTNNRMEMTAVLMALNAIHRPQSVILFTDSMIVVNGLKNRSGAKANLDLWQQVWDAVDRHREVEVQWVPAHAGVKYNEVADALACYHST